MQKVSVDTRRTDLLHQWLEICSVFFLQLNNLEKAVAASHTFLKKNPKDPSLTKNMKYYKTLLDVDEHLVDHEEQPYEVGSSTLM